MAAAPAPPASPPPRSASTAAASPLPEAVAASPAVRHVMAAAGPAHRRTPPAQPRPEVLRHRPALPLKRRGVESWWFAMGGF
uniref:Uncharacterized protein n=1 Tax=Arundo donax TaxID=35708 RepID=A0A0A9BF41_ARUDO